MRSDFVLFRDVYAAGGKTDFTFGNLDNGSGLFTGLAFASGNAGGLNGMDVYTRGVGAPISTAINLDPTAIGPGCRDFV